MLFLRLYCSPVILFNIMPACTDYLFKSSLYFQALVKLYSTDFQKYTGFPFKSCCSHLKNLTKTEISCKLAHILCGR